MMDIIMVGILVVSFAVVILFTNWCQSQIESKKK